MFNFFNQNRKLILYFLFWLLSIGFFNLLFYLKKDYDYSNIELSFLLQIVGLGVISFIFFILTLEQLVHKKYHNIKARVYSSLFFVFFLILGLGLIFYPLSKFNNKENNIVKETQASKNTLISAGLRLGSNGEDVKILQSALATDKSIYPSGIVSGYYGELTKQAVINFQQKYNLSQTGEIDELTANKFNEVYGDETREYYLSQISQKNNSSFNNTNFVNTNNNLNDPDPLVNCLVHENCGGGSRLLKKSICDQSTCCQIGNSWIFYESKDKCKQDQENFYKNNSLINTNNQNNQQKQLVFLSSNNATILCPSEFISIVKDIDSKISSKLDQWNSEYQKCLNNIYETDPCRINCKTEYKNNWDKCVNMYGYSGEEYKTCTENVSNQLGLCYQSCKNMFDICNDVYWERDMLQNQIRIYCK
ncbi:MAG: peptidoglycan-binding protein [Candidatus Woesearchaeota archaeon]